MLADSSELVPALINRLAASQSEHAMRATVNALAAFPEHAQQAAPTVPCAWALRSGSAGVLAYLTERFGVSEAAWTLFEQLSEDLGAAPLGEACDTVLTLASAEQRGA